MPHFTKRALYIYRALFIFSLQSLTSNKMMVKYSETVEKPVSVRLMENVQMQGFRNPEE